MRASGEWNEQRGTNLLDTGAPFYDVYACADGRYVSVAALEPAFYAELLRLLDLDASLSATQMDRSTWPTLRARFAERFLSRSAADWCNILEHTDSCFAPVLTMTEALQHPHNIARNTFVTADGIVQPAPAPRFSATPAAAPTAEDRDREKVTDAVLGEAGLSATDIRELRAANIVQ
jgi:alpha-methylacyl-CoA racemase